LFKNQGKKGESENFYNNSQNDINEAAGEGEQQQGIIYTGDSHSALVKNLFANCIRSKVKNKIQKNLTDSNRMTMEEKELIMNYLEIVDVI
jgi:hypothetical protein